MDQVRVFAPATVANVGCGYDVLGFALYRPGDEVTARLTGSGKVTLDRVEGDDGRLPLDPEKNTVSSVVISYLEHIGSKQGVGISLHKKMPFGSGLGSSAASAVGGLVAVNELMGNPLDRKDLLPFAMEGERLACGNAHADNVAPSLLGGFVLIRSYDPLDVIQLPVPKDLCCALVYPHIEIPTLAARQIIRRNIPMTDAIRQWGNVGALVAGLYRDDPELIGRSLEDVIVEPVRKMLIPGFDGLRETAVANGALGFGISGSGPTVFSLCMNKSCAESAAKALVKKLAGNGVASTSWVSEINSEGAVVLK
ncbi:MAG: homoserine kinase [Marinilabiliales bacterium]|nr:MAG: homoserine kinase [Marinilabiliales bacterium]